MLGFGLCDGLGVICYTFAGDPPAEIVTMDKWLNDRENHERTPELLQALTAVETSAWAQAEGPAPSLFAYFKTEKNAQLTQSLGSLESWLGRVAQQYPWIALRRDKPNGLDLRGLRVDSAQFLSIGERLHLPLPAGAMLGAVGLRIPCCGRFQHGDLHGGNVMLDAANFRRFRYIDYRNSGLSPRFVDTASLHGAVRISEFDQWWGERDFTRTTAMELVRRYLPAEQSAKVSTGLLINGRFARARWWTTCANVLTKATHGEADAKVIEEVLWTLVSHCLFLCGMNDMPVGRRMRLIVWLSALTVAALELRRIEDALVLVEGEDDGS